MSSEHSKVSSPGETRAPCELQSKLVCFTRCCSLGVNLLFVFHAPGGIKELPADRRGEPDADYTCCPSIGRDTHKKARSRLLGQGSGGVRFLSLSGARLVVKFVV